MNQLNKIETTLRGDKIPHEKITSALIETFGKHPLTSQEEKNCDAEVLTKFYNPEGNEVWLIIEAQKEAPGTQFETWMLYGLSRDNTGKFSYNFIDLSDLINYSRTEHIPLTMENISVHFHIKRDVAYEIEPTDLKEACIKEFGFVPDVVEPTYNKNILHSSKAVSLIAAYEELIAYDSEPHIINYLAVVKEYTIKPGTSDAQIEASYERALRSLGISHSEFIEQPYLHTKKGLVDAFYHNNKLIKTNLGEMPVGDYREIVAMQSGYDSYKDFYNAGLRIGSGLDLKPQKTTSKSTHKSFNDEPTI